MRSLLTLSDVMCTGHHAAVSAGVKPGSVVAVVGDGAVGLCGVLAAQRLGASRIIALSRNPKRQEVARAFGATDILAERGEAAVEVVKEMTDGIGADATLECVGTGESLQTAMDLARPGSVVGVVGAPHGVDFPVVEKVVFRNIGLRGGVAPARTIPELLRDVPGRHQPGRVFDFGTASDSVARPTPRDDAGRLSLVRWDRGDDDVDQRRAEERNRIHDDGLIKGRRPVSDPWFSTSGTHGLDPSSIDATRSRYGSIHG
jgi:hypothetical protein